MNGEAVEFTYDLIPTSVNHHLWGQTFAELVDGFTAAEIIEAQTFNIPHVVSWKGDNVVTKFLFAAARQAAAVAKVHSVIQVATDGTVTDLTATATKEVDGITPASKPGSGVMICCFYEYAA
jgi:hypothetical protein